MIAKIFFVVRHCGFNPQSPDYNALNTGIAGQARNDGKEKIILKKSWFRQFYLNTVTPVLFTIRLFFELVYSNVQV